MENNKPTEVPEIESISWESIAKETQEKYDRLMLSVQELLLYELRITPQDLLVMAFGLSPDSISAKKFLVDKKYKSNSKHQISSSTVKKLIRGGLLDKEEKLLVIFNSRENCFSNVVLSTIKDEPVIQKPELDEDDKKLVGKDKKEENEQAKD